MNSTTGVINHSRYKITNFFRKKLLENLEGIKKVPNFAAQLRQEGRLAQLVQSVCLTSRGSAVRIRQRPQPLPQTESRIIKKIIRLSYFIIMLKKIPAERSKLPSAGQIVTRHHDGPHFHCKYKFSISTKSKFHHAYAFTSPDTILSLQIL